MTRSLTLALSCVVLLVLAASPALAQFEGVAEMKMTMRGEKGPGGGGVTRTYLSKAAVRTEMEISNTGLQQATGKASVKTVWIHKLAEPGVVYMLNDEQKSYSVIDTNKSPKTASAPDPKYTVKPIGHDSVAGHDCAKFLVTSESGQENEVCLAKDIAGSSEWLASMQRNSREGGVAWLKALKDAGGEGFPVKTVVREKGSAEARMTMELTKIEKKSLPASLFEIPAGYKKSEFPGAVGMTPEQQEQIKGAQDKMKDALDKMPPEQRKAFEEMMKQRGAGASN